MSSWLACYIYEHLKNRLRTASGLFATGLFWYFAGRSPACNPTFVLRCSCNRYQLETALYVFVHRHDGARQTVSIVIGCAEHGHQLATREKLVTSLHALCAGHIIRDTFIMI